MIDLMGFVNTIITHIANGNKNEERLVNVMGGTIIETESEKWVRQGIRQGMQQGQAKMIIELWQALLASRPCAMHWKDHQAARHKIPFLTARFPALCAAYGR